MSVLHSNTTAKYSIFERHGIEYGTWDNMYEFVYRGICGRTTPPSGLRGGWARNTTFAG